MLNKFESLEFQETRWKMVQEFNTIDDETGSIEIFYTKEFREEK